MIKLFSILLSCLVLIQSANIDLDEIGKLDELIEHAQFHFEEYGDDFFLFISKHYGSLKENHSKEHQEEKKEHQQLPFKHHSCTHTLVVFVLNQTDHLTIQSEPIADTASNFFYQESYASLERSDIFQPPKYS